MGGARRRRVDACVPERTKSDEAGGGGVERNGRPSSPWPVDTSRFLDCSPLHPDAP